MFRSIAAAVVATGLTLGTVSYISSEPKTADVYELSHSVVKVAEGEGYGSGVLVAQDLVVTARHVALAEGHEKQVTLHNGKALKGKVVAVDPKLDIALVQLERDATAMGAEVAKIACEFPDLGETLISIGNPLGIAFGVFNFTVVSKAPMEGDNFPAGSYVLQGASNPGLSGGPAFNRAGEVVGIVNYSIGTSMGPSGLALILPFSNVCHGAEWTPEDIGHGGSDEPQA